MICVCTGENTVKKILHAIRGSAIAEVRIDLSKLDDLAIKRVFSSRDKLIATCRPGVFTESERKQKLLDAISAGAGYVDIEAESSAPFRREVLKYARRHSCEVIVSYHNFRLTPGSSELQKIVRGCFAKGADIAKIACQVNSRRDVVRLLGLLDSSRRLVVLGIGEMGVAVRALAPLMGAEFTMASARKGSETAPGQISADELGRLIGGLCSQLSLE